MQTWKVGLIFGGLAIVGWWGLTWKVEPPFIEDYVTVSGTQFESECRPYFVVGTNTHDMMEAALLTGMDFNTKGGKSGRQLITQMMDEASELGLNVIRTWAHTNDPKFKFQEKPGKYAEWAFQALDWIIEDARRHGMKVILSFVDNWKYYNGVDQYIDWSSTAPKRTMDRPKDKQGDFSPATFENEAQKEYETSRHALFYIDSDAKEFYKNHVYSIVNRKNSYNGRKYKDDPTILAWNLLNEPRCETWLVKECTTRVQKWIKEMAAYVKALDPNHLVTIGSEGFYGEGSHMQSYNPQTWASDMGQNFTADGVIDGIDFVGLHIWPNNWDRTEIQFQIDWVNSHIKEVQDSIHKPLLLEEFGKKLQGKDQQSEKGRRELRDPVYAETYDLVEEHYTKSNKSVLTGSLFWRWRTPLYAGQAMGEYDVDPSDSTTKLIREHARYINQLMYSVPPREECSYECWIPNIKTQQCENKPQACQHYWEKYGATGVHPTELGIRYYTSQRACCEPARGGLEFGCKSGFLS
eukprot:TRINITY_DN1048_c0_g1_i10.p1 TRINITY_DN1048_c0_g1~~TRINITY_DN1048_c0_g1_i10.p1  ORF type:complete len:522 (-),score=65.63 TRINITY_DN1048_c0_g1_i10:651-2216(-)